MCIKWADEEWQWLSFQRYVYILSSTEMYTENNLKVDKDFEVFERHY